MRTTFITVEGLYGAGKSTISQYIARQLALNNIPVTWFDEYELVSNFFLEFFQGFQNGEKAIGHLLVAGWQALVDTLHSTPHISVLDGPFMTNNIVRMLAVNHTLAEIAEYAEQVSTILTPLNPEFIYLTSDIQKTLERTCNVRGANWTAFIVSQTETFAYQKAYGRTGFEGLTEFFVDVQRSFDQIAHRLGLNLLSIDTTSGNWDAYRTVIFEHLEVSEKPIEPHKLSDKATQQYIGLYNAPDNFPGQGPFRVEQTEVGLVFKTSYSEDYKLIPETDARFNIQGTRLMVAFLRNSDSQVMGFDYTFWDGQTYRCSKVASE